RETDPSQYTPAAIGECAQGDWNWKFGIYLWTIHRKTGGTSEPEALQLRSHEEDNGIPWANVPFDSNHRRAIIVAGFRLAQRTELPKLQAPTSERLYDDLGIAPEDKCAIAAMWEAVFLDRERVTC